MLTAVTLPVPVAARPSLRASNLFTVALWAGRPEHSLSFPVSVNSNPESEFDQDSDSESESDSLSLSEPGPASESIASARTNSGRYDFKLTQGLLHSFPGPLASESLQQSQPPADTGTRQNLESGPNLPVKPDSPQAPLQAAGEPVQAGSEPEDTEHAQVATMSDRMFAFMMQNLTLGTQVRMIFCVPIASAKRLLLI